MIPSKNDFRIVFMGTPEFAVESLRALTKGGYNVVGVVTNPDKPAGRGRRIKESAVKAFAREQGLNLLQPHDLKNDAFAEELKKLKPSLQVVVAFKILPAKIFDIPSYGTFNLHASLLPDYRGAAPINHAIINGEKKTGVTTFFLDKRVDTGKIIQKKETRIEPDDNAGSLHDKLMIAGGELVRETVEAIRTGRYSTTPQQELIKQENPPKKAPKIFKEDCKINWCRPVQEVYNFIRGLSPYPAAWTELHSQESLTMKIYKAQPEIKEHGHPCGSLHSDHKSYLKVATPDGFMQLDEIQQSGKKRMSVTEFLKGFRNITGYECT